MEKRFVQLLSLKLYVTASEKSYEIFSGSIDAPEISSF